MRHWGCWTFLWELWLFLPSLHKLTYNEKQWRHSLVSWNPVRSELSKSRARGHRGLHPSLNINIQVGASPGRLVPPNSRIPVPVSVMSLFLSLSLSVLESFSVANGVTISPITGEFLVQQLSPWKRKLWRLQSQACSCHRNSRNK